MVARRDYIACLAAGCNPAQLTRCSQLQGVRLRPTRDPGRYILIDGIVANLRTGLRGKPVFWGQ